MDYEAIRPYLEELPQAAAGAPEQDDGLSHPGPGGRLWAGSFPPAPTAASPAWKETQLAGGEVPRRGLLIDYGAINGSLTNYAFQADSTYFIEDLVQLYGTTSIEGGTAVKVEKNNYARIVFRGPVDCRTSAFQPAHFSARDDDTIGQTLDESTGTPTGFYGYLGLVFYDSSQSFDVHDIHIRHLTNDIALSANNKVVLSHAQLSSGWRAVWGSSGSSFTFRNVLFDSFGGYAFFNTGTNRGEHGTFHRTDKLVHGTNYPVGLTNSLLISVTNNVCWNGSHVQTNLDDTGIFQTAGSGSGAHYLAPYSSYRNAATTNITSSLLGALRAQTTHPPVELTDPLVGGGAILLTPQVPRDTDIPDLGFHYQPMDWVAHGIIVSNVTLILTNGVVLGTYGGEDSQGLLICDGATVVGAGTATQPCRVVRYNVVQGETNTAWASSSFGPCLRTGFWQMSPHATNRFRFVDWSVPAAGTHFFAGFEDIPAVEFVDCQFHSGIVYSDYPGVIFTNCLLERVHSEFGAISGEYYHNLFYGGTLIVDATFGTYRFADNLFDNTDLFQNNAAVTNSFNAYVTNADRLIPSNTVGNVVLTNNPVYGTYAYQGHVLGRFYYATNDAETRRLIDAGSTFATNVGLYFYTTTMNQVKEGGTTNDIGFHYVALTNGAPVDTDGDGLADYFEDENGNGDRSDDTYSFQDSDTDGDGLTDLQNWELSSNVLVNDPADDDGNDKNSQSETTLLAFDQTVIVAYVDTALGYAGYGMSNNGGCYIEDPFTVVTCLPPATVEFIGWSLSRDGGSTFVDQGNLPLLEPGNKGNAGDPVLARDSSRGLVYLVGNPQRPSVYALDGTNQNLFVPFWRSTNNGQSFLSPLNAVPGITSTNLASDTLDKPGLIVDDFPGTGNGDVYLAIQYRNDAFGGTLVVSRSEAGGTNWQVMTNWGGMAAGAPTFAVTPNHEICVAWLESRNVYFSRSTNRWTNATTPSTILTFSNASSQLKLYRSKATDEDDWFSAPILPAMVANPGVTGHLYMVYHDVTTNGAADLNIYFIQSTNSGTSWSERIQVSTATNSTDQWQPAITVKPDGTKLFIAWYDRREDTANNSLIRPYGVFATLPVTNSSSFGTNFMIGTVQFPPAFTGTNNIVGTYDPAYPPLVVESDSRCCESFGGQYRNFMGNDYDTAVSGSQFVYYTWSDNRLTWPGTNNVTRHQADVRFIQMSSPP